MSSNRNTRWLAAATLLAALALPLSTAFAQGKGKGGGKTEVSYQIIELDGAGGTFSGYAWDINNSGLAVGRVHDAANNQHFAACWEIDKSSSVVTTRLRLLIDGSEASGVNDRGEIAGRYIDFAADSSSALYWVSSDAIPLALPAPAGARYCEALSINNDGIICGWAGGPDPQQTGFAQEALVWRINFEMIGGQLLPTVWGPLVLPELAGADVSSAWDVNDVDGGVATVAGESQYVAVTWTVIPQPDGSLSASPQIDILDVDAYARGVNSAGAVCGFRSGDAIVWEDGTAHVLDKSATFRALGGTRSITTARAHAISGNGVVVGFGTASVYVKAVVWPSTEKPMILLDDFLKKNGPFTELNQAWGVNDAGEIVGWGWDNVRGIHPGFLAVPK